MSEITCPRCGAKAREITTRFDARFLDPPPRQVEPFVELYRWQCLSVEAHHGEGQRPIPVPT